jgi:HSP20 family protein
MYNKRAYAVLPRTIGGFLEDAFQNGWNHFNEEVTAFSVPVNIHETDKNYEVHLVAAGLKKEDFKISIDRNILTIAVDQNEENKEATEGKWLRSEYRLKSFKRSFTLNDKIDTGNIAAKYNDGVLVVTLPKKEVSEPTTHQIAVN